MGPGARSLHALDLLTAEVQRVHALLDVLNVPRVDRDLASPGLTMAQRMELYVKSQQDTRDILRRIQ